MDGTSTLLHPTLHVEVAIKGNTCRADEIKEYIKVYVCSHFATLTVGQDIESYDASQFGGSIMSIEIADYTGPPKPLGFYAVEDVTLDVQTYILKNENELDPRRRIAQADGDEQLPTRNLALPSSALKNDWNTLVFDDALPARLLRYLTRMVGLMKQPGLNLAAFNWNRLCLLHGPPGSGKSTLCRALAQKLSIRLGDAFTKSTLVEINTNAMLSKYFGESGKLIGSCFERIFSMAQDGNTFVCVVMDEVETIAGSRERSTSGAECGDGLRATNQLLTALDRLRGLPNIIVLCTSNLIGSIDQAFLDRVDIKQLIPPPSPEAIYNIFRSCLNELVRSSLVDTTVASEDSPTSPPSKAKRKATVSTSETNNASAPAKRASRSKKSRTRSASPQQSWTILATPEIPMFSEMMIRHLDDTSPGRRVWVLAQKCHGFSGRTLRRLPILGLAMYTWGGTVSLDDAVSALEAAVAQELIAMNVKPTGVGTEKAGS